MFDSGPRCDLKISVITVCRNNVDTIRDTIISVRDQVGVAVEHVIVDGASDDETLAVIQEFPHISRVISEPDRGLYDALNKGLRMVTGDVVGIMHADDVYEDVHVLYDVVTAMQDTNINIVYGDLVYVERQDLSRVVRRWQSRPFQPCLLARGWMPPHPTLFIRRDVYARVGGFDLRYKIAADYDCILRIFKRVDRGCRYLPRTLVRMRVGGVSNRSVRNLLAKSAEDWRIVREHSVGGFWTVVNKQISKISQLF